MVSYSESPSTGDIYSQILCLLPWDLFIIIIFLNDPICQLQVISKHEYAPFTFKSKLIRCV